MGEAKDCGGSIKLETGQRVFLTSDEAKTLWDGIRKTDDARRAAIPDEKTALGLMMDAYVRLKQMGWNDAKYCPKDGSIFEVIEVGSTGIFDCYYSGEWPDGCYNTLDGGEVYPSSAAPALFRLKAPSPSPSTRIETESDDG